MTKLKVAAAQSASVKGNIEANVACHLRHIDSAAAHGVQMIVFPELSLTGYELDVAEACALDGDDVRLESLREAARRYGMTIIAGGPLKASPQPYLAAFVFLPDGRMATYAKRNLYPGEDAHFQPGTVPSIVATLGERVASAICWDLSRAEFPAEAAKLGATVYAAGVFDGPEGILKDALRMSDYARTYQMIAIIANHGAPCSGEASGGRSGVWNPSGEQVVEAPGEGEFLAVATREESGAWRDEVVAVRARTQTSGA